MTDGFDLFLESRTTSSRMRAMYLTKRPTDDLQTIKQIKQKLSPLVRIPVHEMVIF
jgi:hypothetical protein